MALLRLASLAGAGVLVGALGGCETIGNPVEALTGKRPAPDEFQVLARAPLNMPPSLNLPTPRPGEPSPLEPNPQAAALAALGRGPELSPGPASRGETALLDAANVSAASPDIRVQLQQDQLASADEEYRPPTIPELFGAGPDLEIPPEEVLDPVSESQRLQTVGVRAPNDPDAEPIDETQGGGFNRTTRPASSGQFYPSPGGAPRNTFDNTNTRETDPAREAFVLRDEASSEYRGRGEAPRNTFDETETD